MGERLSVTMMKRADKKKREKEIESEVRGQCFLLPANGYITFCQQLRASKYSRSKHSAVLVVVVVVVVWSGLGLKARLHLGDIEIVLAYSTQCPLFVHQQERG